MLPHNFHLLPAEHLEFQTFLILKLPLNILHRDLFKITSEFTFIPRSNLQNSNLLHQFHPSLASLLLSRWIHIGLDGTSYPVPINHDCTIVFPCFNLFTWLTRLKILKTKSCRYFPHLFKLIGNY